MTDKTRDDNDTHQRERHQKHDLTPAAQAIHKKFQQNPEYAFCSMDFPEFKPGTMRNIFSKLKKDGLIELECRSPNAFYKLKGSSSEFHKKPMTITAMGGNKLRRIQIDFSDLINSLPMEELCKVHDIHLMTPIDGIYKLLEESRRYQIEAYSKNIVLNNCEWSRNRSLKVVVHCTNNVSFYLNCSNNPIESSAVGFVCLAAFLGGVRNQLISMIDTSKAVPKVEDWIVVLWHYGRDGAQEFSGERFNITFKMWCGLLARIYIHQQDKTNRLRFEVIQKPKKTLRETVADKLDLCCNRCGTCSKQ